MSAPCTLKQGGSILRLRQLQTPALFLDCDIIEANARRLTSIIQPLGIGFRPHYKSHRTPAIARMQISQGARGITCAKLGEAVDLVEAGIENVLIANQVVDRAKLALIATLAGRCHFTVCVDNPKNIEDLQNAAACQETRIHCLVEYEMGINRCGVHTFEDFLALARQIDACKNLVFEGIQAYAGHLSHEENPDIRIREAAKAEQTVRDLRDYLSGNGLAPKVVSGHSTGTIEFIPENTAYTEVQIGSYLFMDEAYSRLELGFKPALFMLATVMSTGPATVADVGKKSFAFDQGSPALRDYPGVKVVSNEEHSVFSREAFPAAIGDKVVFIPGHACTTFNLNDWVYLVRRDTVVDKLPVVSRGKSW